MRIDTKEIPGLRDLSLDTADSVSFESALPTAEAIRLAWGNPDLESIISDVSLGEDMTATAARANRWVQGITAAGLGVPSAVLPAFERAVWKWGGAQWEKYATGAATSAMDLGLEAMGCVPLIGVAAKFAFELVRRLIEMSKKKKRLAAALTYDKSIDEDFAGRALRAFHEGNARNVFMPPATDVRAWRVVPNDSGFSVSYEGPPVGLGVLPGTNIVAGQLVSPTHWSGESYLACNASGRSCSYPSGSITTSERASVRRDWDRVFEGTIGSAGDHRPSLRRVGAAMWSAVSSTRTAAAFEFDTRGVASAWEDWTDAAYSLAADAMNGGIKRMYLDRYVGFQALQKSTRVGFYGVDGNATLGEVARSRMSELRRLQMQLLDTTVVAYCSEKQPAFQDPELRNKLRERRAQLLSHMARWGVSAEDIIDTEYRAEFEAATADNQRPLAVRPGTGGFEGKPQRVSPLAGPSETGGSASGLILLAGAAAFVASI